MNIRLQEIVNCIPIFRTMTKSKAVICVWNNEAVVEEFFGSDIINLYFEKGYQVEDKNDKIYEVLRTRKPAYNKVPKEAYGVAFEGSICPVMDGNEVVGAVTYCFPSDQKDFIAENTELLTKSLSQTDSSIEGIKTGTTRLASNMEKVHEITEKVQGQIEDAQKVVATIQNNAKFSNILALNASIESARAGQAGKGFAVVSDEMRKFSKMSGDAAQDINGYLGQIVSSLDEVRNAIENSTVIADEQADAANHLHEMFDSVMDTAKKVSEICKDI